MVRYIFDVSNLICIYIEGINSVENTPETTPIKGDKEDGSASETSMEESDVDNDAETKDTTGLVNEESDDEDKTAALPGLAMNLKRGLQLTKIIKKRTPEKKKDKILEIMNKVKLEEFCQAFRVYIAKETANPEAEYEKHFKDFELFKYLLFGKK